MQGSMINPLIDRIKLLASRIWCLLGMHDYEVMFNLDTGSDDAFGELWNCKHCGKGAFKWPS